MYNDMYPSFYYDTEHIHYPKNTSLFNLHAEYIMWNVVLDEAQAGIKFAGRTNNNLRYPDDTTFMAENKGIKEPLDESASGVWKSWLKTQHSETKIMASGLIIRGK